MNWLDILLISIFVVSILAGAAYGLVRESVSLAAAILGIVFAARFYETAAQFPARWVDPYWANVIGFFLVLFAFQIAGALVGRGVSLVLRTAGIGWVDRVAGAAFGGVRAVVLSIGLILVVTAFPRPPLPDAIIGSRLAPYFVEASYVLSSITPPELKDAFSRNYEEVKRAWDELWNNKPRRLRESVI